MPLKRELVERLHMEQCSCVIANNQTVLSFHQRGVKDLHRLLHDESQLLKGAFIADKVVGTGAAALMIAGGAKWVYAKVVSRAALALLASSDTEVEYEVEVPYIINRSGTGVCPVEQLCAEYTTAEDCLPAIDEFVRAQQ